MVEAGPIDTEAQVLFARFRAELDAASAVHGRLAQLFNPGGDFARLMLKSVLQSMLNDREWFEAIGVQAMAARAAGIDVIDVLNRALAGVGLPVKSGDQVRETAAPITVAAEPLMAAKIAPKGRPDGRNSGTAAGGEPGAGRGPLKPSGGAPEPPAGIAAQSEPSGGENLRGPAPGCAVGLWTEDPAASGEFICLQQKAPADVAARNPNYQAGSKHHAREKQFYTPKLYQAIYSEQHRWIMAAGGQLPTGWILPAGAVLGADGHVTE
jgi:hypothetical protein